MRRKKIGTMNFHGSVDVTDPCYDRDVWCRMNDVKIKQGEYDCYIWRHTDKGEYEDISTFAERSIREHSVTCRIRKQEPILWRFVRVDS